MKTVKEKDSERNSEKRRKRKIGRERENKIVNGRNGFEPKQ